MLRSDRSALHGDSGQSFARTNARCDTRSTDRRMIPRNTPSGSQSKLRFRNQRIGRQQAYRNERCHLRWRIRFGRRDAFTGILAEVQTKVGQKHGTKTST
jgi:hypothetical protein